MKKSKKIGILSCFLAVLCCTGLVAQAAAETSVINPMETGVVDIYLEEYQKDERGKEKLWEDNPTILPGMFISKIPRIKNEGYDCYVRAQLEFDIPDMEDSFREFGDGWFLGKDGYYYCDEVLKTGDTTDIFQGIEIPIDFPQDLEQQQFHLDVKVDAIQSKNFEPDWEAEHPWGLVEIQECQEEAPYDINTVTSKDVFQVVYEGSAKRLFAKPDNFFKNFPVLMPGDTYKDSAKIENNSKHTVTLYFEQQTRLDSKLLKEMDMEIRLDGQEVYRGKMNHAIAKKVLCKLNPGEKKNLEYQISIPKELDNDYTLEKDEIKWIFTCNEEIKPSIVQTGDMGQRGLVVGTILFGMMGFALIRSRKEEK